MRVSPIPALPIQDFPPSLNPHSLANRRHFSWFPLANRWISPRVSAARVSMAAQPSSGMDPCHKAVRQKKEKNKSKSSSYRVLLRILSLLPGLSACVSFSEFLGICFFAFGPVFDNHSRNGFEWFYSTLVGIRSSHIYFSKFYLPLLSTPLTVL